MFRAEISRPVALAVEDEVIRSNRSFFDFGCGRGTDVAVLSASGIDATGWDPVHFADAEKSRASVVNLGYVVNVIEDPEERRETLRLAWQLATTVLIVAARLDWDVKTTHALPFRDGILTAKGTFQKFFTQEELQRWIEDTLGTQADAAAPGVFYVFRHQTDREEHLARATSRRSHPVTVIPPSVTLDQNRELLEPLLRFMAEHGRSPVAGEIAEEPAIISRIGSLHRAIKLLARATDVRPWEDAAITRQRDLLVYLALGTLRRQPKFSVLPTDLRTDIKHFFGSYSTATRLGRELLFSAGQQRALAAECTAAAIGKLLPDALYVHVSSISDLPVLLRVYEGCGRVLLGDVPDATLVKLRRDKPKISYLCYQDFDDDPHPRLRETFVADLKTLRTYHRDYAGSDNPPVLHRKECFVAATYPRHSEFAALTQAEDGAGLLADSAEIGTARGWDERLAAAGFAIIGHELIKSSRTV